VQIRDPGIGIPASDLPWIFGRFRRGTNVTTETVGIGLGLAGARDIVALHGGTMWIESEEGTGTTVFIRLPLAAP
jgi:signal transduction histidine kinase